MEQKISFAQYIKEELVSNDYNDDEVKSILSSFIRTNGTITFSKEGEKLILKTENANIAKFIYKLLKEYYKELTISFSFVRVMKLYKNTSYLINILNNVDSFLNDVKVDFLNSKIQFSLHNSEDKIRGYLIGTFLACGSCNDPSTSNYHFEFSFNNEDYAMSVLKMIGKIKSVNFAFKEIKRRNKYVLYLKRSDQISDLLAFFNASNSCLEFENKRMDRDFSNSTNRLMNCDSYNFKKTMDKSMAQLQDIDVIDKKLGIDNISNVKLRELCKLRRLYPEATFTELAAKLSEVLDESVSKSNVNHLFIKLKKTVEAMKDGD